MIQAIGWMLIGFGLGYMLCGREPNHAPSARPLSHAETPLRPAFLRYSRFSCGVQRNSTRAVAGFLRGGLPLGRLGLSMPNSSPYKYPLQSSPNGGLLSVQLIKEAQMLVILTDNTGTIFNRANIKQESLAELNRIASEATGGNTWWEPDLSEEEVSRECRGCGRIMSRREASEQHACNDCATGERR